MIELQISNTSTEINVELKTYESVIIENRILLDFMETFSVADIFEVEVVE